MGVEAFMEYGGRSTHQNPIFVIASDSLTHWVPPIAIDDSVLENLGPLPTRRVLIHAVTEVKDSNNLARPNWLIRFWRSAASYAAADIDVNGFQGGMHISGLGLFFNNRRFNDLFVPPQGFRTRTILPSGNIMALGGQGNPKWSVPYVSDDGDFHVSLQSLQGDWPTVGPPDNQVKLRFFMTPVGN